MKKIISLVLVCLLLGTIVSADNYAIYGGIKGDLTLKAGVYNYQEICFISGQPVKLYGTVTLPKTPDKENYKVSYKYQLASQDGVIKLDRTVSYDVTKSSDNGMQQTIVKSVIPVGGLKESYTIDKDKYELASFQYNKSDINDIHPGITFASGNLYYKKVFYKNGDASTAEGVLTVVGESKTDLAYKNHWSELTTRIVDLTFDYEARQQGSTTTEQPTTTAAETQPETTASSADNNAAQPDTSKKATSWSGSATLKFSTDKSTAFNYVRNDVQNISFRGGLLKTENSNVVLQYSYDMPDLAAERGARNKGEGNLNTYTFEDATRLPVPKYKDIAAHWGEEACFRMGSLEGFAPDDFFFPDLNITREQFAMALINSIDHLSPETVEQRRSEAIKLLRPKAEPLAFDDISRDSLYYIYIKRANDEGLMIGEGNAQFLPTRPLTRQEAITIMVRALGIQDIAPARPYNTGYNDDADISDWAKDAIYMARESGIVKGYPDNTARPLALMTRAEASTLLSRFIDHLREDITTDYREKLLNKY